MSLWSKKRFCHSLKQAALLVKDGQNTAFRRDIKSRERSVERKNVGIVANGVDRDQRLSLNIKHGKLRICFARGKSKMVGTVDQQSVGILASGYLVSAE